MNRRHWIRTFVSALAALGCGPVARSAFAQSGQAADLNETLRFGLKCRRPLEFEFVALVVQKVDQKLLPRELVLSAMTYAQLRNKERPYPYFEFSMKKRAAAIGVEL
jgi:hypothetical protein